MGLVVTETFLVRLQLDFKQTGQTVVLTNGCFDAFHAGHLRTLQFARRQGDVLVVAVNTDESVRALKGPHRPMYPLAQRMEILCALKCVDYVMAFGTADDPSITPLLEAVRPDVLVKGGDYTRGTVISGCVVERHGGRVVIAPVVPGLSSTRTIERLRDVDPDDPIEISSAYDRWPGPHFTAAEDVDKGVPVEVNADGMILPVSAALPDCPESRATGDERRSAIALVDLDGVLVDFVGSMARALGKWWDLSQCRGEYDLTKTFDIPTDLSSVFGPDFWEAATWMPDGEEILQAVLDHFPRERIFLCSRPTRESSSPMGKLRWIERHMGESWLDRYIFCRDKSILARPGAVLIDDCDANLAAFRAAGGSAVLVPRPWNSGWELPSAERSVREVLWSVLIESKGG